jgi:hypothetical protein
VVYAPDEKADTVHSSYFSSTPICTLWCLHRRESTNRLAMATFMMVNSAQPLVGVHSTPAPFNSTVSTPSTRVASPPPPHPLPSSSFWVPRNVTHHIDRQARTGDPVLVKSREMAGRVGAKHCRGEYRRGKDDKIVHWPRCHTFMLNMQHI